MGLYELIFGASAPSLATFRASPGSIEHGDEGQGFICDLGQFATQAGGQCEFTTFGDGDGGISRITAMPVTAATAQPDYCFPYVTGGYGSVTVPVGCPAGTIVGTGAMNGCRLLVSRDTADQLHFYHDANGQHLTLVNGGTHVGIPVSPSGTVLQKVLCDIPYAKYAKNQRGSALSIQRTMSSGSPVMFQYHLISIRRADCWEVYSFGVLTGGPGIAPEGFRDGPAKLVARFPEDG